jgi:leucyl aminopeptidase
MEIKFKYKKQLSNKEKSDCVILFLSRKKKRGVVADKVTFLPDELQKSSTQAISLDQEAGKKDTLQLLMTSSPLIPRILLVGLGKTEEINHERLRRAAGQAGKKMAEMKLGRITVIPPLFLQNSLKSEMGRDLAEGIALGSYSFLEYKTDDSDQPLKKLEITICDPSQITTKEAVTSGELRGVATNYARSLGNMPSNDLTPTSMAKKAQSLAKKGGLKIKVLDEKKMKALGMNMLLGVSQGSEEPAKLVVLEYNYKKSADTIALVGKGVTFDSGGISLKRGLDMDEMKFDMCGAAAVLGAMKAVAEFRPKLNVIAVIPTSENLPGGKAQKPGDIVKSYAGKKVEILNTDAEGRLLLGDALTYAAKKYKPQAIIDLATLTGACVIALGRYASGAITNDDELCEKVVKAGKSSGDQIWPLPNFEEYEESLKGKYADLKNIGNREAGAITGGLFLKNFVEKIPWVHIDIAGTAWNVEGIGYHPNSGATGVGVRLLIDLIADW